MKLLNVDDELVAREKFSFMAGKIKGVDEVIVLSSAAEALSYDVNKLKELDFAFLDIVMPGMLGVDLAKRLKELNPNIKIIFLTAYNNYASEAFSAGAVNYLLKPYGQEDLERALNLHDSNQAPKHRVYITLMPWFDLYIDGEVVIIGNSKIKELLAYLVFLEGKGATTDQLISVIWPGKPMDDNTRSLCRSTFKRLKDRLDSLGIGHIVETQHYTRYTVPGTYSTDVQKLLAGDKLLLQEYDGRYLENYPWAKSKLARINYLVDKLKRHPGD